MSTEKSDCSNHKRDIGGIADMKQLAEMIGDLHYETLTELFTQLHYKLLKDAKKDWESGRHTLSTTLEAASETLIKAAHWASSAWAISKPFMQQPNDPNPTQS